MMVELQPVTELANVANFVGLFAQERNLLSFELFEATPWDFSDNPVQISKCPRLEKTAFWRLDDSLGGRSGEPESQSHNGETHQDSRKKTS